MKCNAHLNNTFYSYFRVHGRNQPRVFFTEEMEELTQKGVFCSMQC